MTQGDSEKVVVKPSPIQGLGVFAARSFLAGERIRRVNVVREISDESPLQEEAGECHEHCAYPDGRVVLWEYPDRHVNHSCDPNAYELHENGEVHIVACRDIPRDEEITFDYNINTCGGSSRPCHCGATRCRGETIGDYFALPEDIQLEYRPLLADWFVKRYRGRLDRP